MSPKNPPIYTVIDGNEAAALSAHKTNEVCVIYPITPSSQMGEFADQWSSEGNYNIWQTIPHVIEMQSEAGAVGALHGALQTGALATTFTASQGLLLMIPDMFHIAAELLPTVFHVACRSVGTQGMTIYCEHSDVMATRMTGFAMLCSANVQEAHDFALIAQAVSLESRIPFLHFFDGFRTSHEVAKIELLQDEQIKALINDELIAMHRERKMTPEKPVSRGNVVNQDIFFQYREIINPFYAKVPEIFAKVLQQFKVITGREYQIIEYFGDPKAESIIVIMGSAGETVHETVQYLNANFKEKVGMILVRLFRPLPKQQLIEILPKTCKAIAVMDRTKEPGSVGEPLYEEVLAAITEGYSEGVLPTKNLPKIIGGRFGIASKEFTPAMVKAIFAELAKSKSKNHFTIGIDDDVGLTSLAYDANFNIESDKVIRAIFYGLGADGTVSANKNTVKIIGEETDLEVQAYFIYDAKKSGSKTISHLRFGPEKIRSEYLIEKANFIGCHQTDFVNKINVLEFTAENAVFLLNSNYAKDDVWDSLPRELQQIIIERKINFYVIDAYKVANETGMRGKINTIMQTCFFALSNVLPKDAAVEKIKNSISKTYAKKGDAVIQKNFAAVDQTLANLFQVNVPKIVTAKNTLKRMISEHAPQFVQEVIGKILHDKGHELPVSALPLDGSFPTNTTCFEKNSNSQNIANWLSEKCIQCGQCSMVCPHGIIRAKYYNADLLKNAPKDFRSAKLRGAGNPDKNYTLQIYAEDCTGCGLCQEACPVKAINLKAKPQDLTSARENIKFFESLPLNDSSKLNLQTVRGVQYLSPMFEFCGACPGCGEAAYVKLLSQLFGDHLIIANACGCSSVFGGLLPTSPWVVDKHGHGPTWASSLFEDNAEFGFGFRLTADKHQEYALELLDKLAPQLDAKLVDAIKSSKHNTSTDVNNQRELIKQLKQQLHNIKNDCAKFLLSVADHLIHQSVWSIGGDGWAYDIGYGGLDHVLQSGRNINMLVLDTEVYSNTGGQASKATPRGAAAKFAASGKPTSKKDLGLIMMTYGNIYVASIALGANPTQAIKAFQEAENYAGPSLIIAYSHCIAHGIEMHKGLEQQKLAVKCGYWPLYRYNPALHAKNQNPFQLDSAPPSIPFKDYAYLENRYQILLRTDPERAAELLKNAEADIAHRWMQIEKLK